MTFTQKRWLQAAAAVVLCVHLTLLVLTARDKSITSDEPFHIARGVSALFSGDFRMSVSHPPLVNVLCAVPLLFLSDLQIPYADPVWRNPANDDGARKARFAKGLLWAHTDNWRGNDNPLQIIFWCRAPVMLLSVALGLCVFLFTSRRWDERAGFLALVLYAFSPTALAHGCLVTTDTGSALFIFLFGWALVAHLDRPSRGRLLLLGLTFGLAQLTKFTAILLVPLLPVCLLLAGRGGAGERLRAFFAPRGPAALTGLWACLGVLAMGAVVIWAGYGFELRSIHRIPAPDPAAIHGAGGAVKSAMVRAMAAVPLPPRTYYYGLSRTLVDTEAHPHPLYFMGRTSNRGWWYYYPALFAMKEPLALLALMLLGLGAWRLPPPTPGATRLVAPALAGGMVLFFMFFNAKNIGIRHLLPAYPFLFVALGRLAGVNWRRAGVSVLPALAWALAAWYAANGVASCPDYLVHFNTLAGGTDGGLRKSVVGEDWGQDVPGLARFVREQGIREIYYNPYGRLDAREYGVPAVGFECGERPPGWYAVHIVDLLRPMDGEARDCYADLAGKKPYAILNHTIYVYHLMGEPGEGLPAQGGPPAPVRDGFTTD